MSFIRWEFGPSAGESEPDCHPADAEPVPTVTTENLSLFLLDNALAGTASDSVIAATPATNTTFRSFLMYDSSRNLTTTPSEPCWQPLPAILDRAR